MCVCVIQGKNKQHFDKKKYFECCLYIIDVNIYNLSIVHKIMYIQE